MHAARSVRVAQLSALLARLFARSTRLLDKMPTPEEISELKEINEFLEEHGVEEAIALAGMHDVCLACLRIVDDLEHTHQSLMPHRLQVSR